MTILLNRQNRIKADILAYLQTFFDKKFVDVSSRVRIECDLDRWKPEIEYFAKQADYDAENFYEVCFDGIYICTFSDKLPSQAIVYLILKNLTEKYQAGDIELQEQKAIEKVEKENKAKQDEEKAKKASVRKDWENTDKSQFNDEEKEILNEMVEKGFDDINKKPRGRSKRN